MTPITSAHRSGQVGIALGLVLSLPAFAVKVPAAGTFAGLSLRVANAEAPPGGTIQLKVLVTEPRPIIIGHPQFSFAPRLSVLGVLLPGSPDAAGAAVIQGGNASVRVVSPSGKLGLSTTAPVLAITLAVPAPTPVGSSSPLTLDPAASSWLDPAGQLYTQQIRQGTFVARGLISINDVLPGGGFLPAGSVVTVVGLGFQPGVLAEIDGFAIASVTWVDSTRIDIVTASAGQLDGKKVTIVNPDRTRAAYFSYLRATALGTSSRPLLAATEPIYPVQPNLSGSFTNPQPAAGTFLGLALQNPNATGATVAVELLDAGGVVASSSLVLPPRSEIVREASELLTGVIPQAGSVLRITASAPIQMVGLAGNENDGSVTPLLPAP